MAQTQLFGDHITLILNSPAAALAAIEAMDESDRAQVSPVWLERIRTITDGDPWCTGFTIVLRDTTTSVGMCAFKGPPNESGEVEIAYGIEDAYRCRGFATEAAGLLTRFALTDPRVRIVCAHTLPEVNASGTVLTRCGFVRNGDVIDPEDGLVWLWEFPRRA